MYQIILFINGTGSKDTQYIQYKLGNNPKKSKSM